MDPRSILIAVIAAGVVAAALGLAVGVTILWPLGRLTRAARALASGNLSERVSPRPSGEVGKVADAFNQMAQTLQDMVEETSRERHRLTAALNSSIDAAVAVDPQGRVTFANLAAEHLFARSQKKLVGNPFAWILPDEQVIAALRSSREEGRQETRLVDTPNHQHLQVITAPIVGGGDWATLVVFHDLTDARRVEQVRRDFIANVSHELRTPLASIKSVVETLESGALDDRAVARELLARADGEVDRLVQLVEELLELSRLESGQAPLAREPVDIETVLARAAERLRPQAAKRELHLTVQVAPELPPVAGDAERLERVVVNLIHNALKFTPAGGSIRVSAGLADGAVTVQVSDTGVGISPEDLPRIFERFYKADRARNQAGAPQGGSGGTGLGLAVVKHTVEAHGGSITVESDLGRGSTFSFSIPLAAPSPEG